MEYILIIGLVVGFILLFVGFKIHKQWMENTIDHKIRVTKEGKEYLKSLGYKWHEKG